MTIQELKQNIKEVSGHPWDVVKEVEQFESDVQLRKALFTGYMEQAKADENRGLVRHYRAQIDLLNELHGESA